MIKVSCCEVELGCSLDQVRIISKGDVRFIMMNPAQAIPVLKEKEKLEMIMGGPFTSGPIAAMGAIAQGLNEEKARECMCF